MTTVTAASPSVENVALTPAKAKESDLKLFISDAQMAAAVFHLPSKTFTYLLLPQVTRKTNGTKFIESLNSFIENEPLFKLTYNSVAVSLLSQSVTLIPERLFDEAKKEDYLNGIKSGHPDKIILSDHTKGNDFTIVFSEDRTVVELLRSRFQGCSISHVAGSFIRNMQSEYGKGDPSVIAYVLPGKLQIAVIGKSKPVFYNIFSYRSPEDFIYFIVLIYKKLNLDPEKTPLIFYGEIVANATLFDITLKYIRNIAFGKRAHGISFSEDILQLPSHFYYNLFCMV